MVRSCRYTCEGERRRGGVEEKIAVRVVGFGGRWERWEMLLEREEGVGVPRRI